MNLTPKFKATATLQGLQTGPLSVGSVTTGVQAALMPFLKGDKGEKGDKGDDGDVSTAPINGGFF
jgi:hypothetical protein